VKILFFIESLRCGGKERRLLELIQYLKKNTGYEMNLVLTENNVQYPHVNELGVPIKIIKRKYFKRDPILFFRFYKICNEVKPDIIHTWGSMLAFYSLPVVIIKKIPHINSHITNVPLHRKKSGFQYLITNLGFKFSDIILANSYSGLKSYDVSGKKCRVIYNGIRLDRFSNLADKEYVKTKFNIRTPIAVIMVASYAKNKNYNQLIDVAEFLSDKRSDITFLGVGDTEVDPAEFERIKKRAEKLTNIRLYPKINEVESLVNTCDIGLLFTYSEGISNAILEYMACGKPVIANAAGGTTEIITNNKTGFLLTNETTEDIARLIVELADDENKRHKIGQNAKLHIEKHFAIDRLGQEFCQLYTEVAEKKGLKAGK
jgi:glycosyltransferase involved in cell wall biosynthesis